jgi:TRAP-type mannitol/chloroaromatic compound transport system permease small subunit
MPLMCDAIDAWVRRLAVAAAALIVVVAFVQIGISVLRYFYSFTLIAVQELVPSLNVTLVSASICYALLRDAHTRVDIFTQNLTERGRVRLELGLVLLLLVPTALFLAEVLFSYVGRAWTTLEGSRNVGGLGGVYIVKTFLLLMAVTLSAQALSIVMRIVVSRRSPYVGAATEHAEL